MLLIPAFEQTQLAILKDSREEEFARVAEVIQESTQDEFLKLEVSHLSSIPSTSNKILSVYLHDFHCF